MQRPFDGSMNERAGEIHSRTDGWMDDAPEADFEGGRLLTQGFGERWPGHRR